MMTGNTNGAPMAHPATTLSTPASTTSSDSDVVIDIPDNFNLIKLLVKYRLAHLFHRLGRGAAIAAALSSDPKRGIRGDGADVLRRKAEFSDNTYPKPKPKSFFFIHYLDALCDVVPLALLVCATVTLGFSIKDHALKHALYGVAIFVAVFIYLALSAAASHWQAKQDDELASESANVDVNVVRDGRLQQVPKHDVVVGDVVKLKAGDAVPADGVFLTGRGLQLKVDESIISCDAKPVLIDNKKNPFLATGVKVVHGHGRMLVTAVGINTAWGKLMKKADDLKSLQERVEGLILTIGKIAVAFAVVTFTVLHRHFTGSAETLQLLDNGIPLPLAVTLMLTFYLIRIMKHNTPVHRMSALKTMASVTVICADKTGTLTPNQTKVIDLWVGTDQPRDATAIAGSVVGLLCQAVVVNTTGHVYKPDNVSPPEISGSPTEKALLSWAMAYLGMSAATFEKKSLIKVLQVEVFRSSKKKYSRRAIARDNTTGKAVAHWKGDAEVVLAKCSMHVDTSGAARELAVERRNKLEKVINDMTVGGGRCIAFAYKQLDDIEQSKKAEEEERLTLLGLVGLKDQCQPDVKGAIDACGKAGVTVKMLTRDNIVVARAIAMEFGIISSNDPDDAVMEGRQFRAMPAVRQAEMVDKIRVIAKSGPLDKLVLVKRLKQKGHVVAVTGNGTNDDVAALKEADVVLSMSIQGTDVSKDTIILNDKFDTVVTAILSGRHAYNIFQRFSQFHITVNVVAMSVKFVSAVTTTGGASSLTTVQLILWVNLVMGTVSTLAVAMDKPNDALMNRPPVERTAPLISNAMWRNLTAQAAFQIAVLLAIQYSGTDDDKANGTMIFNVFVLCQLFNEFNARETERKNIFAGLLNSREFVVVIAVALVLQAVLIELLKRFTGAERLGLGQWGVCVAIAAVSWPIGWAVKFIPVPAGCLGLC